MAAQAQSQNKEPKAHLEESSSTGNTQPDNEQFKRHKPSPISQPVYKSQLTVNSSQAHRVMKRSFGPLAGSLFRSDVIIRIIKDDKAADDLETIIQKLLDPVVKDLKISIEQSQVLLEQNKIKKMPNYTMPQTFNIEVKSPQIGVFARIVAELDRLMVCIDALWMNGIINNKQRSYQTYEWQQRLVKLANRIIDFERRARRRATELGKQSEVEAQAPASSLDEAERELQDQDGDSDNSSSTDASEDDGTEAVA